MLRDEPNPTRIWCDVAFSHPEIPVRIEDAHRARGVEAKGVVCVVIDVLRATTSIAAVLENGCAAIHPCASPEAARTLAEELRRRHGAGSVLLGGEQDGKPIPGFDGGNSPREYTRTRIGAKTLVFSTSNGTKTLFAAQGCGEVFTAAFVNLGAAAARVASVLEENPERTLLIACSGREGAYCEEDAAAAGMFLQIVCAGREPELSDTARAALRVGEVAGGDLEGMLLDCWWGRHLCGLGLRDDVVFCARRDVARVVPKLEGGAIRTS